MYDNLWFLHLWVLIGLFGYLIGTIVVFVSEEEFYGSFSSKEPLTYILLFVFNLMLGPIGLILSVYDLVLMLLRKIKTK